MVDHVKLQLVINPKHLQNFLYRTIYPAANRKYKRHKETRLINKRRNKETEPKWQCGFCRKCYVKIGNFYKHVRQEHTDELNKVVFKNTGLIEQKENILNPKRKTTSNKQPKKATAVHVRSKKNANPSVSPKVVTILSNKTVMHENENIKKNNKKKTHSVASLKTVIGVRRKTGITEEKENNSNLRINASFNKEQGNSNRKRKANSDNSLNVVTVLTNNTRVIQENENISSLKKKAYSVQTLKTVSGLRRKTKITKEREDKFEINASSNKESIKLIDVQERVVVMEEDNRKREANSDGLFKVATVLSNKTEVIQENEIISISNHADKQTEKVNVMREETDIMEKHSHSVGTPEPPDTFTNYECRCGIAVDSYDAVVCHAQVHLVQLEALIRKNGPRCELKFDNRHDGDYNDRSVTNIKFDYRTLLTDSWFHILKASVPSSVLASSLYKYTRSVWLDWDLEEMDEGVIQGRERSVPLYKCGVCNMYVEPAKVQNHCENYRACVALEFEGHECPKCQKSFYTHTALKLHMEDHVKNTNVRFRIVTFNNEDDVKLNKALKQMLHNPLSFVEDEDIQTMEQEEITGNPELLMINILDKNVEGDLSQYEVESHSTDRKNKERENMYSIEEKESCFAETEGAIAKECDDRTKEKEAESEEILVSNYAEASKSDDAKEIEDGSDSAAIEWNDDNGCNDSNPQLFQMTIETNLRSNYFERIVMKEHEAVSKTSHNQSINSNRKTVDVVKEVIVENGRDNQSVKLSKIFGDGNHTIDTLEADNGRSCPEDLHDEIDNQTVQRDDGSKENEDIGEGRDIESNGNTAHTEADNFITEKDSVESSNYVSINSTTAILHGSFHQGDTRFKTSRNKQCTGIAAVACARFNAENPNSWSQSVVDNIVITGDKYYNDCIAARTLPAAGELNPDYLAITDLMPIINNVNQRVSVTVHENSNYNGHIDNDNSVEKFPNLENALKTFFREHAFGILTANAVSVAVCYRTVDDTYWMFDSHSRGPEGECMDGMSCCMRFNNLTDLYSLVRRNLFKSPNEANDFNLNVFSLTSLSFRPST